MRAIDVKTPDGLAIAAGPKIVFLRARSQSALSWTRQLTDPGLAKEFRMIAYDFRGHGASDKPAEAEKYLQDRIWADDLASVITDAGFKGSMLGGWRYRGRVL